MGRTAGGTLQQLIAIHARYGEGLAGRKVALLRDLLRRSLSRADQVRRFHELLCFLRAYPDDARVLATVEAGLGRFDRRRDLRRHRHRLADSGIAGTSITYRFFAPTARWLAARWGARLAVDWPELENEALLRRLLYLLVPHCETPPPDELPRTMRAWVDLLRRRDESDAAFLIRRVQGLDLGPALRDWLYEELDLPVRIDPGPDTPSRTRSRAPGRAVLYRTRPLDRSRPDLRRAARQPPGPVREVPRRRARAYVDLAREAMVTRSRDLDVFAYGNAEDVRMVELEDGLQFALIGVLPAQRYLLESVYGFVLLQNHVPIGYALAGMLFGSAEVAYNVFDTYRGGEAARVYGRILGTLHHLFGIDAFTIEPYQLGHHNPEAIDSGAWWFYQKLGFRPRDRATIRLMRTEERRMRTRPAYRSGPRTLERLSRHNVFYHLGAERADVLGLLPLHRIGVQVSRYIGERFGSDVEAAARACGDEAAALLGVRSRRGFSADERRAWARWAPLVAVLPGVRRWSVADRRALAAVIRAKGAPSESDYLRRLDRHRRLRRALLALAAGKA